MVVVGGILLTTFLKYRSERETGNSQQSHGSTHSGQQPGALVTLSDDKQDHIWTIEHWAFELEQKFGPMLLKAIQERDANALAQLARPGFGATLPDASTETTVRHSFMAKHVRHPAVTSTAPVSVTTWAKYMAGLLEEFENVERPRLRVLAIDTDRDEENLWRTELLVSAKGTARDGSRIAVESVHDVLCRFKDEADIEAGPILEKWVVNEETVRTSRAKLFEEVTQKAGLARLKLYDNWKVAPQYIQNYTAQIAVGDYDRDGFLDIAVAGVDGVPHLLRSIEGKRFENVATRAGIRPWHSNTTSGVDSILATWIDYDNDGFPDLIMGKTLYHNVGGQRFEDVTEASGLKVHYDPMGAAIADYDGDGLLDIYILYQHTEHSRGVQGEGWVGDNLSGTENSLWKNMGGGRFMDVTSSTATAGGPRRSFAATWFYADEDHHPDLYVANDFGHNVLLLNDAKGDFKSAREDSGVADYSTSMGVATGDLNNDGDLEIYVANMYSKMGLRIMAHVSREDYPPGMYAQVLGSAEGNRLYSPETGNNRYFDHSLIARVNEVGWAHAPAFVDLDSDGLLDIYATSGFMSFGRGRPDG